MKSGFSTAINSLVGCTVQVRNTNVTHSGYIQYSIEVVQDILYSKKGLSAVIGTLNWL